MRCRMKTSRVYSARAKHGKSAELMALGSSGDDTCLSNRVEEGSIPFRVAISLAYSLLGEGTRLLTENEVGSNPTMPASFRILTA